MLAGKLGITARRIEPGADGGGAEVDLVQKCGGFDEARLIFSQHHHEGAEFLAERHRHGVLQLRTADLDEAGKLLRLAVEGILQHTHGSGQIVDGLDQPDIDRGRIGVVGRLAEIDMVIRVKASIIAFFVSEQFERTVGDDLVGIHVGGGAGSALNFIHHELLMQRAGADFAAGLCDGFHAFGVEKAELVVCACRRLLHIGQSPDEIGVVADGHPGDLEVFHSACRVHAPIDIRRNFLRPEQIMLLARHAHFFLHWLLSVAISVKLSYRFFDLNWGRGEGQSYRIRLTNGIICHYEGRKSVMQLYSVHEHACWPYSSADCASFIFISGLSPTASTLSGG